MVDVLKQMDVCVQSDLDAGMSQELGDGLDVHLLRKERTGKGMPQGVQTGLLNANILQQMVEGTLQPLRRDKLLFGVGNDVRAVRILGAKALQRLCSPSYLSCR